MYKITIVRQPIGWVVVDGVQPKSRLVWHAAGLDVYVRGPISGRDFPTVANIAMNEAIARRIPARALREVGR